jgi:Arc/MetJ-type ribon-helix-helix transcriptional regulator
MSKITFRADDELVTRLEEFDASKSEVLRDALREYLDSHGEPSASPAPESGDAGTLDNLVADRVDALIADRLEESFTPGQPQDINVNVTLDGVSDQNTTPTRADANAASDSSRTASNRTSNTRADSKTEREEDENTAPEERKTCTQCGEDLSPSHVYCPNCGEKSSHRVFCDCGDELRSDWAFCPGCGQRTPAADVLDGS